MDALGMPSLAVFGGSYANEELIREVSREGDPKDFFGSSEDLLGRSIRRIQKVISEPMRRIEEKVRRHFHRYQDDEYRLTGLTDEKDFVTVPEMLHMPILRYAPVRKLFDKGNIHGFGYDHIPEDDPYDRLCKNGHIDEDVDKPDDDGYYIHWSWWKDDDPDVSLKEIDAILDTRNYIDYMLANTDYDPTDYPNTRG